MNQQVARRSVLIGGLAAGLGASPQQAWAGQSALALTHVTVIDPERERPQRDMTVLLSGTRIMAVGPAHRVRIRPGTRVIDLTGKYLIPGLADMHAHSIGSERISPPLYALNGVTTVREMASSSVVSGWRAQIERGQLLGPNWIIAGPIVDGRPSLLAGDGEESDGIIQVSTAAQGRDAVRRSKASGADFVKLYSRIPEDAYFAIVDEARRLRIPVAGHSPDRVLVEAVIAAGHRSIEHLHTLPLATSSRPADVRRALAAIKVNPGDYNGWFRQIHPIEWLVAQHPSAARRDAVFEQMVRRGTRSVPTLIMHQLLDMPESAILDDDRLRYVPIGTREFWKFILEEFYIKGRSAEEKAQQRELYPRRLEFVHAMQRAGVRLLAGSEAGLVYAYPGFSLHDELTELVRAGLTPLQSLRMATTEAADFLGTRTGSIRSGCTADLVVLDANPLIDIRNTTKIHAVVVNGRLIDSTERRRLLADVESAAAEPEPTQSAAALGCICHMPRRR
ncbi:amidohydrolase family protein [Kribbella sp. NPDC056345]|uniref:amidohydrolase family protein n=1 Tax=Kribbella sp. NPDC056345 TaxID=3345789 RepID=UPI0035E16D9C